MPIAIDTLGAIQQYMDGVSGRAAHHASNVTDIALAVAGAVFLCSTGEIEVRTYNGSMANMLWFEVKGQRYALAFNHGTQAIELRDCTKEGRVLASFTNDTPTSEVRRIFMEV